jgi:hypothetical protein
MYKSGDPLICNLIHSCSLVSSDFNSDLFFTSNSSLINKIEVIPGISDHKIVYIEANLKPRKVVKPPRKVFLYNKANTEKSVFLVNPG